MADKLMYFRLPAASPLTEEGKDKEFQNHRLVMESQYRYIEKHFGTKRAEAANYGWSSFGVEEGICTKVYGLGEGETAYVTSRLVKGRIIHTEETP